MCVRKTCDSEVGASLADLILHQCLSEPCPIGCPRPVGPTTPCLPRFDNTHPAKQAMWARQNTLHRPGRVNLARLAGFSASANGLDSPSLSLGMSFGKAPELSQGGFTDVGRPSEMHL